MSNVANIKALSAKPPYWGWVEGLYLAGNDCGVAMRLLDGQGYEPESRALWKRLCTGAEMVVDIGAHTGIFSLDAWRAGAKEVISIEPYYMNFARLVMNLRHSGFGAEWCVLCAASDESRRMALSIGTPIYYCSAGGRMDTSYNEQVIFMVKAMRLDSLIREEFHSKIKVVKIDTEKHGVRVLNGMQKILSHKPDLILECTEDGMTEILKPLGYRFYKIHEKEGLSPVESLSVDLPFTFDSPNRYATCS